jgi:cytochrome c peroxidase
VRNHSRVVLAAISSLAALILVAGTNQPNMQAVPNSNGVERTFSTDGAIKMSGVFFQPIGTNSRACVTCHQPKNGWSIATEDLRARFDADGGLDPVFRPVDGSVCPSSDVSNVDARRNAYRLLLNRGLIRIQLNVPSAAEFTVDTVDDPYACAETTTSQLALYRRPLPATNLRFLTSVMWDGRESGPGMTLQQQLKHQALIATTGHAQGATPTDAQLNDIVNFELSLYTAQSSDIAAGELDAQGGKGGPVSLSKQPFSVGVNDPFGSGNSPFDPSSMTLFSRWASITSNSNAPFTDARLAIARGEQVFNTHPMNISRVKGMPDMVGTCSTCHNTPNVGNSSVAQIIDIGINDASRRTPDMPLYTLRNKITGETIKTMDPGLAMITGKWADISKAKSPALRGLSSRAPYFHNGSAENLDQVLSFYQERFRINLTPQERADLKAFLSSL